MDMKVVGPSWMYILTPLFRTIFCRSGLGEFEMSHTVFGRLLEREVFWTTEGLLLENLCLLAAGTCKNKEINFPKWQTVD